MTDEPQKARPDFVTDEHLEFLNELRDSGITHLETAAPFLVKRFDLSIGEAREVLEYWMETY
jgi:hypothetical protein